MTPADEADPRAELVRRLQEYERFKRAAEGIDRMPRLERDTWVASADLVDRKVVRIAAAGHACRKCCWPSRKCCRAATCSPITTCSASRCRCGSA